jgi:hypothetical protein
MTHALAEQGRREINSRSVSATTADLYVGKRSRRKRSQGTDKKSIQNVHHKRTVKERYRNSIIRYGAQVSLVREEVLKDKNKNQENKKSVQGITREILETK